MQLVTWPLMSFRSTFLYFPFCISPTFSKHHSRIAGFGRFPGRVTYTFIPDGSVSFVILPGLTCSFPLTLIRWSVAPRDAWRVSSTPSYLHCGKAIQFLHGILNLLSFLTLLGLSKPAGLRALEAQSDQNEVWVSNSMECLLWLLTGGLTPLEQKLLGQQNIGLR